MSWNVRGAKDPPLDVLATVIVERGPDVVAAQEIRRRQARRLANRLGWSVRWTRKHFPLTPLLWWRAEGVATLSPHPMSDARRLTLTPNVSTWTHRHRVLLATTVHRGAAMLRIYNAHLASNDPPARIRQARLTARLVDAERQAPISARHLIASPEIDVTTVGLVQVVAGDLNEPDLAAVLTEFSPVGLIDPGGGPTNPSEGPHQRLDYVLVPASAQVHVAWVPGGGPEWARLSDHLPVAVSFTA